MIAALQLLDLAKRKALGDISQRDIDAECMRLKQQFTVKQKTIDADLSRAERRVKDRLAKIGLLDAQETALIPRQRDYADRYAIVQSGGQTMIYDTKQSKLSQALMTQDSFDFANRNDWFEVEGANGGKQTIYPAREFLKKPPRNARVYRGGFVFQPSKTVNPDQCNLYRGFAIKPDPSGSCNLAYKLMEEVWTYRQPEVFEWVQEWCWHIFAHPGESVGTALALRGEPGHGKSIFFEQCLPKLLGDMLLRVTDQNLVLGAFNESLATRLLIPLEEAAFAGDKKVFEKLKELITGKQVVVNGKFKAPVTLDNYARFVIISNNEHFLHVDANDRRYTVLESSPTWQGTEKFSAMVDQWNNGGAERFLYDALNHPFRKLGNRLVINTKLKTEAEVQQVASCRSKLKQALVDILLDGQVWTVGNSRHWPMDQKFSIPALELEEAIRLKVGDGRAPVRLHDILEALKSLVGEIDTNRPKAPADENGYRQQLPTQHVLPPRRQAIEHARKHGLITHDEYNAAPVTLTDEEKYQKQVDWFRKHTIPINKLIQKA